MHKFIDHTLNAILHPALRDARRQVKESYKDIGDAFIKVENVCKKMLAQSYNLSHSRCRETSVRPARPTGPQVTISASPLFVSPNPSRGTSPYLPTTLASAIVRKAEKRRRDGTAKRVVAKRQRLFGNSRASRGGDGLLEDDPASSLQRDYDPCLEYVAPTARQKESAAPDHQPRVKLVPTTRRRGNATRVANSPSIRRIIVSSSPITSSSSIGSTSSEEEEYASEIRMSDEEISTESSVEAHALIGEVEASPRTRAAIAEAEAEFAAQGRLRRPSAVVKSFVEKAWDCYDNDGEHGDGEDKDDDVIEQHQNKSEDEYVDRSGR